MPGPERLPLARPPPCGRGGLRAFPVRSRASARTLSHARAAAPVTGPPPCRATRPRLGSPLGSPRTPARRCASPNVCNLLTTRAPEDRSIPERAACAALTAVARRPKIARAPSGAGPPCGNPTPRENAIDVALSASASSAALPDSSGVEHAKCPSCAAFSAASRIADSPLTLPIAPSAVLDQPGRPLGARTASAAPPSRGAASALQSAFHRQMLHATAFAASRARHRPAALPPTGRLPTLLRPRRSRADGLDRARFRGLIARGRVRPRAACRLLQPTSIHEHDHRTAEPRAPRPQSPAGAALAAGGLRFDALSSLDARPAENSRVRGRLGFRLDARHPSGAIARAGSFAPTRSARTPRVANTGSRALEKRS